MSIAYLLHLIFDAAAFRRAESIHKPVDAVYRLVHMEVAAQVPNRLELAARVEQTTHHQMAEHIIIDGIVANPVIERAVNQLRTTHPHLGVGKRGHEI